MEFCSSWRRGACRFGLPARYKSIQSTARRFWQNNRTSRIRKLVLESGPGNLNRWLDYERDVRADFIKTYGEEPGALVSIGIMTDTDNTETTTTAWYGPVRLLRGP